MRRILTFVCLMIAAFNAQVQAAAINEVEPAKAGEARNTLLLKKAIPADGTELTSISTIELVYGNYTDNVFVGGIDKAKQPIQLINKDTGKQAAMGTVTVPSTMSVVVTLDKVVTEPGTYELLIPEALVYDTNSDMADWENGYVNVNGSYTTTLATYNPEQRLTFIIPKLDQSASVEKVNPESGSAISDINTITITFSDKVVVDSAVVRTSWDRNVLDKVTTTGNDVAIDLSEYAYSLVANGGFEIEMQAKDSNGKYITYGQKMEFITLTYFCISSRSAYNYMYTEPASGSKVPTLKEILLVFKNKFAEDNLYVGCVDEKQVVALMEEVSGDTLALGKLTLEKEQPTAAEYYGVKVTLDKEITNRGKYVLLIPEKTIFNKFADPNKPGYGIPEDAGVNIIYNPHITLYYEVEGGQPSEPEVRNTFAMQYADPADNSTVESLKEVQLVFSDPGNPLRVGGFDGAKVNVELKNTADNSVAAKGVISWFRSPAALLTFDKEVTASGTYMVTIPEGTIYDDKAVAALADFENCYVDLDNPKLKEATYNPEFTLTYTVKGKDNPNGINQTEAFEGEVSVYSVQGVFLRKGEAAIVLQGLDKGIYIINSKKVAVY